MVVSSSSASADLDAEVPPIQYCILSIDDEQVKPLKGQAKALLVAEFPSFQNNVINALISREGLALSNQTNFVDANN